MGATVFNSIVVATDGSPTATEAVRRAWALARVRSSELHIVSALAILFTDLVGSTEAVARLGEERAEELRQAHFALLREALGDHGGTEVKNLGDGLMVAFRAASDAVACAVAMQQALARQNRRGGEPLAMRVGVAVGEATEEDGDYFGTPVIEASRLCARTEGGEILVTEMTQTLAGSRGGHQFIPLGPLHLRDHRQPAPSGRLSRHHRSPPGRRRGSRGMDGPV
jgi:class 3 adenylate cyclase